MKNKFMCGLLDKYILQWHKTEKLSFCEFACMKLHVENLLDSLPLCSLKENDTFQLSDRET